MLAGLDLQNNRGDRLTKCISKIYGLVLGKRPPVIFADNDPDSSPQKRPSRQIGDDSLSKAVSKNITRILEDLLKDYDKTERPSYKEGVTFNQETFNQGLSIRKNNPGEGEHFNQIHGPDF